MIQKGYEDEWVCQICRRKIGVTAQILRLWYQIDPGKVHILCYNQKQKRLEKHK